MASTKGKKIKKQVVTEVEVPDGVTLELDQEETNFLYRLLSSIGGDPQGPRGICDRIHQALRSHASYDKKDMGGYSYPRPYKMEKYVDGRTIKSDASFYLVKE